MSRAQPEPPPLPRAGQTTFGALLRSYRLAAGLSQEALAERAGLSVEGLSLLENGRRQAPYRSTIALLVRALGLSTAETAALEAAVVRTRVAAGAGVVPFAALSVPAPATNLPLAGTRFIGREQAMAEVRRLLNTTHLLSLTGTGGVGKTRLAMQVAAQLVDQFPDGVWLVELGALADPALVPGAVLEALGIPEQTGRPPLETLRDALPRWHLLLVLDNCGHVRDACALLCEALLRVCPRLQILATSREPLGLAGETRWRVPSLSLPATDQGASPEAVAQSEAVHLFLERAQSARPSFALTAANAPAVAGICARLDGIPLALELAAACLSALGVADLAARLDQRFRLLTGGSPTVLPRQQTLQATVDWSYGLLARCEQRLFARLSVFAGGWSLEAAEAVGAGGAIAPEEVLDLLMRLVEKSLVAAEEVDDGHMRYRLLETLRQFGRERLQDGGETVLVQRRHASYYLALVENAKFTDPDQLRSLDLRERMHDNLRAAMGWGPDQLRRLDLLEREHDNLRAALTWCLERSAPAPGDADAQAGETGLRLATGLHAFWRDRDHRREGLAWLEQALAHGAAAPAAVRARALGSAGILAGSVNDLARAQAFLAADLALSREVGDRRFLSVALGGFAWATAASGQEEQAAAALDESLALARAEGEAWLIANALFHDLLRVVYGAVIARPEERARAWAAGAECLQLSQTMGDTVQVAKVQLHLGQLALYEGDYARARAAFVASLPLIRALGWRSTVAEGLVGLADAARAQGAYEEAAALYAEGLTLYRELGDHQMPVFAVLLARLADAALEQGDWTAAQTHVAESLALARDTGQDDTPQLAGALEAQAALAAVQGSPGRALRLAGAAAAVWGRLNQSAASEQATPHDVVHLALTQHRLNRSLVASEQATLERRLAPARQALGAEEQATAWAAGQAMTPEQAIADALEGLPTAHGVPLRTE